MNMLPNDSADIFILGEIVPTGWEWEGDTSAHTFKQELDQLGDVKTINLHINSPGGSVFEGVTIGSMLKQHKAHVNVYVDGLAASIASVIAMSGDTIFMPKNSMMMLHNPLNRVTGNAKELRKAADMLDKIGVSMAQSYLMKSGEKLQEEKLSELLDNETWLSAQEAFDYGLCDSVIEENSVAASVSTELFAKYHNVPNELIASGAHKHRMEIPEHTHNRELNQQVESLKEKKIKMLKRGK